MDPGTILAVVQLSASVLKLGREISFEFFGPEKTPEKLKHLNSRLQILNTFLEKILKQPGSPDKLSTTDFPGSVSILKTLSECKAFLEQYRSVFSETRSIGTAAWRVWLTVGPGASRIDEFHKKIDQHYTELEQWQIGDLTGMVHELRSFITSLPGSIPVIPTNHIPSSSSVETLVESSPSQQRLSPTLRTSPVIRPQHRTSSLISIPELPPAAIPDSLVPFGSARYSNRHSIISESEPVDGVLKRRSHDGSVGSGSGSSSLLSVPFSRHFVTLILLTTKQEYQFSADAYQVYEDETRRIIDWNNHRIRVRHIVPLVNSRIPPTSRIPFTKPDDLKMSVTFLPRGSKHEFEITTACGPKTISDEVRYQFTYKPDREVFQRRVRVRQYLEVVQVTTIHTSAEKNIAMGVHLKIWRRDDKDEEPTFSFAWLSKNQPNHHVEYIIRWFKKDPEVKEDKRLILQPYSEDTDLSYGPAISDDPSRRNSTFRDIRRRMSGSSSASYGSSTPSIGNNPTVLYENKGKPPPKHVQNLGYLEIKFPSSDLLKKFVNVCWEAHHPSTRTSSRGTFGSDTDSRSPNPGSMSYLGSPITSQSSTPHHSISEGVGLGVVQLPSPAIPLPASGVKFYDPFPTTMPDPAIFIRHELEDSEVYELGNSEVYELGDSETSSKDKQSHKEPW